MSLKLFWLGLIVLFSLKSQAAVLISVQDQMSKPGWGQQVCETMYNPISIRAHEKVSCFLIPADQFLDERIRALHAKNTYHTHLRIFRDSNNKIRIDVNQWIKDDETDFDRVSFDIDKPETEAQMDSLRLYAQNWSAYRVNRFQYKADILAAALPESKEVGQNAKGELIDKVTLNPISYQKAYAVFASESERNKKYLKTALEISGVLGFGLYLYYKNLASMKVDHDYKGVWDGVSKKLTGQAVREDDNDTAANVGHVFAGEIYFLVARNNGLNFIEASLATLASAATWEFLEYKEVFSINDQIYTGWAGAVMGEVFWQVSRAIKNKSRTFLGRMLAGVFNPVGALNNGIDRLSGHRPKDVYFGDLDTSQWSKFEFNFLVGRQKFDGANSVAYKGVEMKTEIVNIPDWDKPGVERQLFLETPVADFDFVYTKSQFGAEDFKLVTQAILAGLYKKDRDDKNGYEYIIGVSSGFEWDQKRSAPLHFEDSTANGRDLWARAHLIGGTLKAIGLYKGVKFSIEMKLHADYVMVNSYAIELLDQAEGGREGLLSVMKKRGYYYGTGWSQELRAGLEYNDWSIGWNFNRTSVENSGFPHRFDEQITKNYSYGDKRVENRIFVRKILNKSWAIEVAVAKVDREGQISHMYEKKSSEKRTEMKLEYIW